jgi:hypothetical protein
VAWTAQAGAVRTARPWAVTLPGTRVAALLWLVARTVRSDGEAPVGIGGFAEQAISGGGSPMRHVDGSAVEFG